MNGVSREAVRMVLIATTIAVVLVVSLGMVAVARTIELGPKVGDILVFRPGAQAPADWEFAAVKHSPELPVSCKLQPDVMVAGGGSLVVEQRSHNRRLYRVHWAGQRTSRDGEDCGQAADLVLSRADLQLLANVVGGPGVERRLFSAY